MTINTRTGEITDGPAFIDENETTSPAYGVTVLTATLVRWARTAHVFIIGACIAILAIMMIAYPLPTTSVVVAALLARRWARARKDRG